MARHGENIHRRKDGRWEARIIQGYRPDGRIHYKYIYARTYTEVKRRKNKLIMAISAGDSSTAAATPQNATILKPEEKMVNFPASYNGIAQNKTVRELLEEWIEFMKDNIKETTYSKYYFLISRHICPEIGDVFLKDLTTEAISSFTKNKLRDGCLDGQHGLAPKTVSNILSIIKSACDYGNSRHYPLNAAIHYPRLTLPDTQVLTAAEQKRLEKIIFSQPCPLHFGIMLTLYTGMRIGEVCALTWGDIDFQEGIIKISKTMMRIQDVRENASSKTKIVTGRPKTDCSVRTIPLPDFIISYLSEFKKGDGIYINTGTTDFLEPRSYYRKYENLLKKHGFAKYTYHALRHTFATRCVENGFDPKSLSEILGHSDVTITLQRYVHPSIKLKRQHMNRLQDISIYSQISCQNDCL